MTEFIFLAACFVSIDDNSDNDDDDDDDNMSICESHSFSNQDSRLNLRL